MRNSECFYAPLLDVYLSWFFMKILMLIETAGVTRNQNLLQECKWGNCFLAVGEKRARIQIPSHTNHECVIVLGLMGNGEQTKSEDILQHSIP